MEILDLGYEFCKKKGIYLFNKKKGQIGRRDDYLVGVMNKKNKEKLIIKKDFSKDLLESSLVLKKHGKNNRLFLKIMYGCIPDYLQMLDGTSGDLCDLVFMCLTYDYYDTEEQASKMIHNHFDFDNLEQAETLLNKIYSR